MQRLGLPHFEKKKFIALASKKLSVGYHKKMLEEQMI
jgi:hypothetical protein